MRILLLRQHLATTIIMFSLSLSAFGQLNLESVLDPVFNQELIKKEGIKSVTVYADLHEHSFVESGKLLEIEFDKRGNQVYKLSSSNAGNAPFIYYSRGSIIELDSFDLENNHVLEYTENHFGVLQEYRTFDGKNRILTHSYLSGEDTLVEYSLNWENNRLEKVIKTGGNEVNEDVVNEFDEKARLVKHSSGNIQHLYEYQNVGDSLKTSVKCLGPDTLRYTEIYYQDLNINRLTHYVKKDHNGIVVKEIRVEYDGRANAVKYYIKEEDNRYGSQVYPPTSVVIINTYNSQNLLVKRVFYRSREDVGDYILTMVQRIFYEKLALQRKLETGFFEEDEIEEEYIDR